MRWSLVAPGGLIRLVGIGGVMIGLGLAGDLVAVLGGMEGGSARLVVGRTLG
jgi:hypothetical protein